MNLEATEEQGAVVELFASLASKWSPPAEVRRHEGLGFSAPLWEQLVAAGAPGMAVAEEHGGGGSGLLELALAVEQLGRWLAPAPLVEHAVAARLLTRVAGPLPAGVVEGTAIATIALRPAVGHVAGLVPAGAVAEHVIALDGDDLVLASGAPPMVAVPNLASMPLADHATGDATVLVTGDDAHLLHAHALAEWRALTAAALAGLGAGALELGVRYVTERQQFGVPIGSFQSIQHGLADVAVALDGAQLLARKAAWAFNQPLDPTGAANAADPAELAAMAFLFAAEQAQVVTTRALHYHGGYGFMEEYDAQLFYRRAKGWALVLDDPALEYRRLADARYGPPLARTGA